MQDIKVLNVEVFQDPFADVEKEIEAERNAKVNAAEAELKREREEKDAERKRVREEKLYKDNTVGKYLKRRYELVINSLLRSMLLNTVGKSTFMFLVQREHVKARLQFQAKLPRRKRRKLITEVLVRVGSVIVDLFPPRSVHNNFQLVSPFFNDFAIIVGTSSS